MILHYVCRDANGWRYSQSREIVGADLPLGRLLSYLPKNVDYFSVVRPTGDREIPPELVLPRHFVLRGDRLHLKPRCLSSKVRYAGGRRVAPHSHLMGHGGRSTVYLVGADSANGGDLLFASERVVRLPHEEWYQLENLDGKLLDEDRVLPPAS